MLVVEVFLEPDKLLVSPVHAVQVLTKLAHAIASKVAASETAAAAKATRPATTTVTKSNWAYHGQLFPTNFFCQLCTQTIVKQN